MISFKMWIESQTNNFDQWFYGSKVVDNQGKPRIVYHMTFEEFDTFDDSRWGQNTEDVGTAAFGNWFFLNRKDIEDRNIDFASIYPAYVVIKNPYIMGEEEFGRYEDPWEDMRFADGAKRREELESKGHDGIFVPVMDWICAFDSDQIRKAR